MPARHLCRLAVLLFACASPSWSAEVPAVAAASDLKFALEPIAARFHADSGRRVRLAFGSSGNFARQIERGAPFELFLAADEVYVERLVVRGLTIGDGAPYAIGRIVLYAPRGSPLAVDPDMNGLRAALAEGRIHRFAIANPAHAPYGRAAREALQSAGLWEPLQPHLVLGENAAQAAQFARSGNTEGGIIPLSHALAPALSQAGTHAAIPARMHAPLRQRMVLLAGAGETARAFYAYLQQPPARRILRRFGFELPARE